MCKTWLMNICHMTLSGMRQLPISNEWVMAHTHVWGLTTQQSPISPQKSPISLQKSPISPQKRLISLQKRPNFSHRSLIPPQKSPISPQTSPISPQKSPVYPQKSPIYLTRIHGKGPHNVHDVTHWWAWRDLFRRVTWLSFICDATHSCSMSVCCVSLSLSSLYMTVRKFKSIHIYIQIYIRTYTYVYVNAHIYPHTISHRQVHR